MGIFLFGRPAGNLYPEIIGNRIINNHEGFSSVTAIPGVLGISTIQTGFLLIQNNTISQRLSDVGAAIRIESGTFPSIIQNLIYGNIVNQY